MARLGGALLAVLAVAAPLAAQYRGELAVDAVVVPVTVRDANGRVVDEVDSKRFRLFVDGLVVPIQDLARENDLPLSLGFILDTSGSMTGHKLEACRRLVQSFLTVRRPEDQVALWTFGDERVLERFPFGMGWYLLPRILETLKPWSTTALYDMIQRVPEVMDKATHPRRAAILLTDGVDNASRLGVDQATEIAHALETPVYVLGVEPPPRGAGSAGPSYEEVLVRLAEASGGRYRRIPSTTEMPTAVDELLRELSSRFIISFTTSGVGARKYRSIRVEVEGYRATAREGYVGTLP